MTMARRFPLHMNGGRIEQMERQRLTSAPVTVMVRAIVGALRCVSPELCTKTASRLASEFVRRPRGRRRGGVGWVGGVAARHCKWGGVGKQMPEGGGA